MKQRERHTWRTNRQCIGGLLAVTLIIALITSMMGCSDGEQESSSTVLNSAVATSGNNLTRPTPPTLAEILERVELNEEQTQSVKSAYNQWAATIQSRQESQHRENGPKLGPGQCGRGMHDGPPDGVMTSALAEGEQPPLETFLLACSDVLTTEQFVTLVKYLAEYETTQREQRAAAAHETHPAERDTLRREGPGGCPGGGPHGGPGGLGGPDSQLFEDLNLTAEQQTALKEAGEQNRKAVQALIESAGGPEQIDDATREKIRELREQMRQSLAKILTAEQLEQMQELRDARRTEMAERHAAAMANRTAREASFLAQILDLDDTQRQQIIDVMTAAQERVKALHESAREANTAMESLREQAEQIQNEAKTTIKASLSEEQAAVFEAISGLLLQGPGPHLGRMMHR